jgi:hypothetical protein
MQKQLFLSRYLMIQEPVNRLIYKPFLDTVMDLRWHDSDSQGTALSVVTFSGRISQTLKGDQTQKVFDLPGRDLLVDKL